MSRQHERGAAAVEFALVLPLLAALLFGIIEFGWIFNQQVSLANAAREAARYYVVHDDDLPPASTTDAISVGKSAAPTVDWSVAGAGITLNQGCDGSRADFDGSVGKTVVTVASIPMPSMTGFFSGILGPTLSANGQVACID